MRNISDVPHHFKTLLWDIKVPKGGKQEGNKKSNIKNIGGKNDMGKTVVRYILNIFFKPVLIF